MKLEIYIEPEESHAFYEALFNFTRASGVQFFTDPDAENDYELCETDEETDADFESLCECPPLEMDEDPAFSVSDTARLGDKLVLCSLALYRDYGEDRVSFSVRDCDSTGDLLYRVQAERSQFANVISENIYAGPALDLFRTLSDFVPECD